MERCLRVKSAQAKQSPAPCAQPVWIPLIEFAAPRGLILRFIEMMPVSTTEVLDDKNFMPIQKAKRMIESRYGHLIPEAEFRTNGPATYYQIPERRQLVGFI